MSYFGNVQDLKASWIWGKREGKWCNDKENLSRPRANMVTCVHRIIIGQISI